MVDAVIAVLLGHGRGQTGRVMVGWSRALTPVDDPHGGSDKRGGQKEKSNDWGIETRN